MCSIIQAEIHFEPNQVDRSQSGIWRFRHTFGLPSDLEPVSLGEGNTPLVWVNAFRKRVALKCEFLNPSGSFKDRGSSIDCFLVKSRKESPKLWKIRREMQVLLSQLMRRALG